MSRPREWQIVIEPRSKNSPHDSITVAYLPDRESAAIDAEGYAEGIERSGRVLGFDGPLDCGMIRRTGKASWLVRLDTFEFETEAGYDDGYGYLRVREVF